MKIAAIGDLHVTTASAGLVTELLRGVDQEADVLLLAGDLTNIGLPEEMEILLDDLHNLKIPVVAVTGNHDHENDNTELLIRMMEDAGVCVLECTTCVMGEVGFVGTKGFCGGFGRWQVDTFGERALKSFVGQSIHEAYWLDSALENLSQKKKVALMHYSPARDTLRGESEEIYAFLGTSRLGEVLDKHRVDAIFHSHAHHGFPRGRTSGDIVVYNVSRFVQTEFHRRSYQVVEI
jgi:hypothetical protein